MTRYDKMVACLLMTVVPVLVAGGCLVGNDEYDEARRQKEQYRVELNELHQANDFLNKEIARIYNDCEVLSSQLALTAALTIHDRYTAGLQRPQAVAAPAPANTRPAQTARPPQTRPTQTARPPARNPQPGGGSTTTATRPPAPRPGSGGGTAAPPPASPPPSSSPSPGFMGGGSVDLGI